jgi:hypothetical protein
MIIYSERKEIGDLWCWLQQDTDTGFAGFTAHGSQRKRAPSAQNSGNELQGSNEKENVKITESEFSSAL